MQKSNTLEYVHNATVGQIYDVSTKLLLQSVYMFNKLEYKNYVI